MIFALRDDAPLFDEDQCYIAPGAVVIGKVEIGDQSSVWPGTVIRGDNDTITIGERSNIQDGCVLHVDPGFPMTIGDRVTVGHMAMLHGCTIGDNTLIGIGAVIMNGAKIGNNCLIGAKTLITEGKEIPDGSLVMGMPGKVVKQLDAEMIKRITTMSDTYVARAELYDQELEQIG